MEGTANSTREGKKRKFSDSESEAVSTSDESWSPSQSDDESPGGDARLTRSKGGAAAQERKFSSEESTEEESSEEESDTEDDEYSDDDSFVTSDEEDQPQTAERGDIV